MGTKEIKNGKEVFLNTLRDSIRAITDGRYFSNERGYQGALIAELKSKAKIEKIFSKNAIVEQEYPKTLGKHGINIVPDITIYVPYEKGMYSNRRGGNFVVIQLKRKASVLKAREDFDKLDLMFEKLDYPLGIFLNINSAKTFFESYTGHFPERLHCLAVRLLNQEVVIYEQ